MFPIFLAGQEMPPIETVGVATPARALDASATARATVHGVVRNGASGEVLPRALVRIEGDAATGVLTDGEGRFEIPGVPTGPQIFEIHKPGFRDVVNADSQNYNDARLNFHNVLVAAEMPDLVFSLSPSSSIQGKIQLSSGDPGEGINVQLLKKVLASGRKVWQYSGTARTNNEGEYRFAGLGAGVYMVYTEPAMDNEPATTLTQSGSSVEREGYASVFYPEARRLTDATPIRLSTGQQATANINLILEPFHTVTAIGQIPGKDSDGTSARMAFSATVLDSMGVLLPYTAQFDGETHSIQAALPDGSYTLLASGILHPESLGDVVSRTGRESREAGVLFGSVEFVVAGHALNNLRIPLAASHTNTVHLRMPHAGSSTIIGTKAEEGAQPVYLTFNTAEGLPMDRGQSVQSVDFVPEAMEFTMSAPGKYWLETYVERANLCAGSFISGGANLAREPLFLSPFSEAPPMELTLRDDCAKLTLTLPPALTAFLPGEELSYTVFVIPDFDSTEAVRPATLRPSSGDSLTLENLTPGEYHVYTFDEPVDLEYRNPDALAALRHPGQAVTLSPGGTSNLVLEVPKP